MKSRYFIDNLLKSRYEKTIFLIFHAFELKLLKCSNT